MALATQFEREIARAVADGTRIVYQCGAALWLFDPATDSTRRLDIRVPAHRTQAARRFVPAAPHLAGFNVHPAGHSLAVDVRGTKQVERNAATLRVAG